MKYVILFLIPVICVGFVYLTMADEIRADLKAKCKESLRNTFLLGGIVSAGSMMSYFLTNFL